MAADRKSSDCYRSHDDAMMMHENLSSKTNEAQEHS
ncbi:hypothetical protein CLOLEP_00155 [[Clostridium] leptum DSM 753]|uniref:Uncharacterized protein n=1 Tax=[Clostridium] leptum DSM 753 TaxID=428125 RepID=A7VNM9_9FIRM|nr:hypothetical protein CLOLEP_00155 [[Clostridium] leptum DSM 753]